jgi:nucleoside-diphosphate-sugar epimerase
MSDIKEIVIGTGMLGRAVIRILKAQGHQPIVVNRHGGSVEALQAVSCDISKPGALATLLGDQARIYLCASPTYSQWKQQFPLFIEGICQAVKGREVQIVYADNMYAYGEQDKPLVESTPLAAKTIKGRVRAEAAQKLLALHGQDGVKICILRASAFFGPDVDNSVIGSSTIRNVLAGKPAYLVGNPDLIHSFTYLPDQARCIVTLGSEDSAYGEVWHAPSTSDQSIKSFLTSIAQQTSHPLKIRTAGRLMLRVMGLFKPDMAELIEMLYQFEKPLIVNSDKIRRRFGLTCTPMQQALSETVAWIRANS